MKTNCEHKWSTPEVTKVYSERMFHTQIRRYAVQYCVKCNLMNKVDL